jgi:hypothetical protein
MTSPGRRITTELCRRMERLRHGVVLALLALLSQSFVAILPMPAMAGADDAAVLCSAHHAELPAAPRPAKHAPHAVPACPVCQAHHLAANLLPPMPVGFVRHRLRAEWRVVATGDAVPLQPAFGPQQPRAPPSI